jgi:hypothetical protein
MQNLHSTDLQFKQCATPYDWRKNKECTDQQCEFPQNRVSPAKTDFPPHAPHDDLGPDNISLKGPSLKHQPEYSTSYAVRASFMLTRKPGHPLSTWLLIRPSTEDSCMMPLSLPIEYYVQITKLETITIWCVLYCVDPTVLI